MRYQHQQIQKLSSADDLMAYLAAKMIFWISYDESLTAIESEKISKRIDGIN